MGRHLFRVTAMIPDEQHTILAIECAHKKVSTKPSGSAYLSDHTNYTELFLKRPKQVRGLPLMFCRLDRFTSLPDDIVKLVSVGSLKDRVPLGFFVADGKLNPVVKCIPRVVVGMCACATHLRHGMAHVINERCLPESHSQNIFRGALTNSLGWVFIIHYLNVNGHCAAYKHSGPAKIGFKVSHLDQKVLGSLPRCYRRDVLILG